MMIFGLLSTKIGSSRPFHSNIYILYIFIFMYWVNNIMLSYNVIIYLYIEQHNIQLYIILY